MGYLKDYAKELNPVIREDYLLLLNKKPVDMKQKLQSMLEAGFFKDKEKAKLEIDKL